MTPRSPPESRFSWARATFVSIGPAIAARLGRSGRASAYVHPSTAPAAPTPRYKNFARGSVGELGNPAFAVESPSGHVGFVVGLRFRSRVDIPDLLEVSAGRLGRRMLLIPVTEVEMIDSEGQVVVLRADPLPRRNRVPELVLRLSERLHSAL